MPTDTEKEIINERAAELERIGFVFRVSHDSVWYEKGNVKMIPTLMMCASTRDWNDFIDKHKKEG